MSTAKERTLAAQGKTKKPAGVLRVVIEGVAIDIDGRTITMKENERAKAALRIAGYEPDFENRAASRAWVVACRTFPELTFDEMMDAMTIGDLQEVMTEKDADDSPEA